MGRCVANDSAHRRPIVIFEPASEGIGQKFFRDGAGKLLGLLEQQRPKSRKSLYLGSAYHGAAGVDRLARFVNRPPATDDVEVLQRKSERIDDRMTTVARRILTVVRQPLAYRCRRRAGLCLQVRVYAGRGRRYGQAKDIV